jgi:hypothetical protein
LGSRFGLTLRYDFSWYLLRARAIAAAALAS